MGIPQRNHLFHPSNLLTDYLKQTAIMESLITDYFRCLNPYINLRSISNNQPYALSIIQEMADNETQGSFNSYGINNVADKVTVPHW